MSEETDAGGVLPVLWFGIDGGILSGILVFLQRWWNGLDPFRYDAGTKKIKA